MKPKTGEGFKNAAKVNELRYENNCKARYTVWGPDGVSKITFRKGKLCNTEAYVIWRWFASVGVALSLVLAIIHRSSILAVIHQLVR